MTKALRKELQARATWNRCHQGRGSTSRPLTCEFCDGYLAYAAYHIGYIEMGTPVRPWICPECQVACNWDLRFCKLYPPHPGFRMKKTRAERIAEIAKNGSQPFQIPE